MILPYQIIRAFASNPDDGNPAAVVILPPASQGVSDCTSIQASLKALYPPDEVLQATASASAQPMTAFALPLSSKSESETQSYALRWFNPMTEAWLCGHATMATSALLFSKNSNLSKLEFLTQKYGTIVAQRGIGDGVGIEVSMDFPELTDFQLMENSGRKKLLGSIQDTAEYWDETAVLEVMDTPDRTLVELKGDFDLAKLKIDCKKMASLALKTIIFTQAIASQSGIKEQIRTRVFVIVPGYEREDQVTGSAHCLIIPYFLIHPDASERLRAAAPLETEAAGYKVVRSRQVSGSGGDLQVVWREGEGSVRITGRCLLE